VAGPTVTATDSDSDTTHASVEEHPLPPSGEGTVLLDIGGERGALVLYLPIHLDGSEIEIRPAGACWDGTHTGVRERDLREGSCVAAVFGALDAGRYQVRVRGAGDRPVLDLSVSGGTVTEVTWDEA
jgi:hypothetical protein